MRSIWRIAIPSAKAAITAICFSRFRTFGMTVSFLRYGNNCNTEIRRGQGLLSYYRKYFTLTRWTGCILIRGRESGAYYCGLIMPIFIVATSNTEIDSALKNRITEAFPTDHYEIGRGQWLISFTGTARELYTKL